MAQNLNTNNDEDCNVDEWLQQLKVVTKFIYFNKQMQKNYFLKIYVFWITVIL